jgi:hypothetical protein
MQIISRDKLYRGYKYQLVRRIHVGHELRVLGNKVIWVVELLFGTPIECRTLAELPD